MLVRAKEACFIDGHRRRKDAEFEYAGENLPPHLEPVNKGDVPAVKQKGEEPVALSQIAMADSKPKSFIDSVSKKASPKGN